MISESIQDKNVSTNEIMYNDDFIALFEDLELLSPLDDNLIKEIKSEFDLFLTQIDKNNIEKQTFKTFPGCFEKKEKADDPYGDYIIYHEILMYAVDNGCDVIFVTEDVTKGDWMQINKSTHLHYVENFYLNSKRLLYILDGERTFDNILDINFKSLISFDIGKNIFIPITEKEVQHFIDTFSFFSSAKSYPVGDLVTELAFNGYVTLEEVIEMLKTIWTQIPEIVKEFSDFSKLALFRACMSTADETYLIGNYGSYERVNYKLETDER